MKEEKLLVDTNPWS